MKKEMTYSEMKQEILKHPPLCPYCKQPMVGMSIVIPPEELKKYKDLVPVGCCNPECPIQPDYWIRLTCRIIP